MKKQILFMMFLSLAFMFAGMNKVYGQPNTTDPAYLGGAPTCFVPDELTCTTGGGELNPIPGHPYTYTVADAYTNGTPVASVHWFVYDNVGGPLITDGVLIDTNPAINQHVDPGNGSGDFLAAVNSGSYNQSSTIFPEAFTINLSWKYFDPTREVLLVAYITGDECADNIEVFRIRPAFAFILDVASLMPDGTFRDGNRTLSADRCVSEVWSAAYDNDNNLLQIDYGANYLYFLVSAANFGHSWKPTMSATHNASTISEIAWAYAAEATTGGAIGETGSPWHADDAVVNAPHNGTVGEDGQCIVVRVLVEHKIVENADPSTVTLSVEGHMYNPSATGDQYADFHHLENPENAGDPCVDDIADTADYILTPRPKITEVNPPADSFVPKP